MLQYFCSNFTFFFLSWLFPYVKETYGLTSSEAGMFAAFLTLAVFGADMTISPSWSFCGDIRDRAAGAVSGTMNMAGNIGAFATALALPPTSRTPSAQFNPSSTSPSSPGSA